MEENTKEKAKNPIKKYLIMILFGVIAIAGCSIYLSVSKEKHNFTEFKDNHDGTETRICTECAYSKTRSKRLMLNAFDEVVYPYIDCVKDYLNAGVDADGSKDQHQDYTISWSYNGNDLKSYILKYSVYEDFSSSKEIRLGKNVYEYSFSNLYKDQTYYVKLIAVAGEGNSVSEDSFRTTSLGPRVLNVGGLYGNARDLGGYKTLDGKVVQQDLIIRGSSLDNNVSKDSITLTDEGYKFLNETLGIKLEIDLRGENENLGRTDSPLTNARYLNVPLVAYASAFYADQKEYYLEVFRALADIDNYPVYIHCTGGADRTGTVAALILALLNVSYDEIVQDYTLTSFSRVGTRSKSSIDNVINGLQVYRGKTLHEKCERYLTSIGLTVEEISTIKAIMYGEYTDNQ